MVRSVSRLSIWLARLWRRRCLKSKDFLGVHERRLARRTRTAGHGLLWLEDTPQPLAYTLGEQSVTGASLLLSDPGRIVGIGTAARLSLFTRGGDLVVDCTVVRRSGSNLGVRFKGPFRPLLPPTQIAPAPA